MPKKFGANRSIAMILKNVANNKSKTLTRKEKQTLINLYNIRLRRKWENREIPRVKKLLKENEKKLDRLATRLTDLYSKEKYGEFYSLLDKRNELFERIHDQKKWLENHYRMFYGDTLANYYSKWDLHRFKYRLDWEDKHLPDNQTIDSLTPKELNQLVVDANEPYYDWAGIKKIVLNGKNIPFNIFKYKNKNKELRGHWVLSWKRDDNSFFVHYVKPGRRYPPPEAIENNNKPDFRKRNIFYIHDLGFEELPKNYKINLSVTGRDKNDNIVTLNGYYDEHIGDEYQEDSGLFAPVEFGYPYRILKQIYGNQPFVIKNSAGNWVDPE